MTLHWSKTAGDCRVAEFLAPTVLRHFEFCEYNRFWKVRADSELGFNPKRPGNELLSFLRELREMVPAGAFWARTRHRLYTRHGAYHIRRAIEDLVIAKGRAMHCACGTSCGYPADPYVEDALD